MPVHTHLFNNIFWSNAVVSSRESMATDKIFESKEPKTIMKIQAAALGELTSNIVEADVTTKIETDGNGEKYFIHCFVLIAPLLNYHTETLFCIKQKMFAKHKLTFQWVFIDGKQDCECNNIEEFENCMKEILSHEKTTELINSLVVNSQ